MSQYIKIKTQNPIPSSGRQYQVGTIFEISSNNGKSVTAILTQDSQAVDLDDFRDGKGKRRGPVIALKGHSEEIPNTHFVLTQ